MCCFSRLVMNSLTTGSKSLGEANWTLPVLQLWLIFLTCFGCLRSHVSSLYVCFINYMNRSCIWMLWRCRIAIFS